MVNCELVGDELVIRIPVTQAALDQAPRSASGKTKLVASTHGNTTVGAPYGVPLSLSLNLTRKA